MRASSHCSMGVLALLAVGAALLASRSELPRGAPSQPPIARTAHADEKLEGTAPHALKQERREGPLFLGATPNPITPRQR